MNPLYKLAGMSKQSLHQHRLRVCKGMIGVLSLLEEAVEVRKDHPVIGCRKMYAILEPEGIGRDKCENILLGNGFRVKYAPNYKRTTYSQYKELYPNLIEGKELTGINQVWQTDITYFYAAGRHYYLTFIIDVYSRRIVGYQASDSLRAEANIEALKMAFKTRHGHNLSNLIHHSDRGSQYIDKEYIKLLKGKKIKISMCEFAYQNAYTERLNGIIKNEYLKHKNINSYNELKKKTDRL